MGLSEGDSVNAKQAMKEFIPLVLTETPKPLLLYAGIVENMFS